LAALTEASKILNEDHSQTALADELYNDRPIQTAQTARPGTSLQAKVKKSGFDPNGPQNRPQTGSRPLSGFARPGTSTRPGTGVNSLSTPHTARQGTAKTARSGTANRRAELVTAQAYAQGEDDGPFLQLSRINLEKYSTDLNRAKLLFEHIFTVTGDYRAALTLAEFCEKENNQDAYWKSALALCHLRLGSIRKSEEFAQENLQLSPELTLGPVLLAHIYTVLDQPNSALKVLKEAKGSSSDLLLLVSQARLEDARGNSSASGKLYESVLKHDPTNREALCQLASSHFYAADPVRSFVLYRQALQSGTLCAATYNNIGLAAAAIGQVDLSFRCFQFGLNVAEDDEEIEMIWYNVGNVAMQIGEFDLAKRAYKISIAAGDGGISLNNYGVLSALNEEKAVASSLFRQAESSQQGWEALWNCALIAHEKGDEQSAFIYAKKTLELNPDDKQASDLFNELSQSFRLI